MDNKNKPEHKPVLLEQVVKYAMPENGEIFVDGTFGLGGHTKAILEHYKNIKLSIGIDRDLEILNYARENFNEPRLSLYQAKASELKFVLENAGIEKVDGILLDLGVSSYQLDNPERGFSFSKSGPLDMRMNSNEGETAADLVNNLSKQELEKIIFEFGEERFGRKIADAIVKFRETKLFETTEELSNVICEIVPASQKNQKHIHPATKTFQALRIAVNHELEEISRFLEIALDCLNKGGHLSIISFHSLEDRLVKNFIQKNLKGCECPPQFPVCVCGKKPSISLLTKKAIFADNYEILKNPRSRSARLRSVMKL